MAGTTTVTVSGAPDGATVNAEDLGYRTDLEEKILESTDDVKLLKALDIEVSGTQGEVVEIVLQDDRFIGLAEAPELRHFANGPDAAPVKIVPATKDGSPAWDSTTGTLKFLTSSFSPFVLTVPDVTNPATKNDDASMNLVLGPEAHITTADGIKTTLPAVTQPNFTIILDTDGYWNPPTWGAANNLEIKLNGRYMAGYVLVPAGKTMTITGSGTILNTITVDGGSLILKGAITLNGGVTLQNGNLYIDGSQVSVAGTLAANGNSFIEIASGNYAGITAEATAGGHISGGTYANMVPANVLATGFASKKEGERWVVYQNQGAVVKTVDGSISFTRNGGYYVEFFKGTANAAQNYSFQFATAPKGKLLSIDLVDSAGAVTSLAGLYSYDSERVVIGKNVISPTLNNTPAGRGYFNFNFDTNDDTVVDVVIEVPINIYPSVTYEPTKYVIDSFEPVVFTMTSSALGPDLPYNPGQLMITQDLGKDENPYNKLLHTAAYTISGNQLTLSALYLNSLTPGVHNFGFWYDLGFGKLACLDMPVLVSVDYKVTQINAVNLYKDKGAADVNWYQYSGKNLSFTANGDVSKFSGVRVDGYTVPAGYYTWASAGDGSTNVQLYPGYLAKLAMGKHTIEIVFTDGIATAEFSILSASASPKTGDNNHLVLWAGLLVLSGAAVVALIPKKKKQ